MNLYMKSVIVLLFFLVIPPYAANAQSTAGSAGSEKQNVKKSELANIERSATPGKINGSDLSFDGKDIHLVITTGPEDDMLSFRIQGLRNPNIVVPAGAKLTIVFINTDEDMLHDVRVGNAETPFPSSPIVTDTVGTSRLQPMEEDETMQSEQFVLENKDGVYKYFCSVRGHAKGGMWGNLFVGIKPGPDVQMAPKPKRPSGS
jgi:rusticyanin